MRSLCILVTGDPVGSAQAARGDFASFMRQTIGASYRGGYAEIDARLGEGFLDPASLSGLVITGSPASVNDRQPWMLKAQEYLRHAMAAAVPVLGVCFGHQMLAEALGGSVSANPRGREIGTVELTLLAEDPVVFDQARPYQVNMSHVDSVVRLPPGAELLGRTALDPHAAIRFAERVWGVQFHPEFDAEIVGHYANTRAEQLRMEGLDPEQVTRSASDAPQGAAVLRRFVSFVQRSGHQVE